MSREQWGHGYYSGVKAGLKARMSFYDYVIAMHDGEDSPYGDFAYDIQRDEDFPKTIPNRIDWRTQKPYRSYRRVVWDHITSLSNHACTEARRAFIQLWSEYKRAIG